MSETPDFIPKRGAAGFLFVACLFIGAVGLALDLSRPPVPAFWVVALPGARALLGIAAAIVAVVVGHLARVLLARRTSEDRDHAADLV